MPVKKKLRTKPRSKARATHKTAKSSPKPAKRKPAARVRTAPHKRRPVARRAWAAPSVTAGPTELDTIKLAYLFRDTPPSAIYRALLDSREHSTFTQGPATIEARVGGAFRCFDGFITGRTLELVPDARIVQAWRTRHFPKNNLDSTVELTLTPVTGGTRLEMRHIDVPKDQVEFIVDGWVKYYWDRLARHLGKRASERTSQL